MFTLLLLIWLELTCQGIDAERRFRLQQDLDEMHRKSDREHQKNVEELHRRLAEIEKEETHTFSEELYYEEHGYYPGEKPKRKTACVPSSLSCREIAKALHAGKQPENAVLKKRNMMITWYSVSVAISACLVVSGIVAFSIG